MAGTSSAAALGLALGTRDALEPVRSSASVDLLVGVAVLALGAVAAALLAFGSIALLITHTLQAAGHAGRSMQAFSDRCTPIALRRIVAVGLGAGLGLLGPAGMAGAAEPDLGWTVTSVSETEPTSATSAAETAMQAPAPDSPLPPVEPDSSPTASPAASPTAAPTAAPAEVAEPTSVTVTTQQPHAPVPVPSGASATTSAAERSASAENSVSSAGQDMITVRAGDSLWSIASADLGSASPSEVAARWPRWYAANREVIGEDPDLIRPGQTLVAPGAGEGDA